MGKIKKFNTKGFEPEHWHLKEYKQLTIEQISFSISFWELWSKGTSQCRLSINERRMFNISYTALKKLKKEIDRMKEKKLLSEKQITKIASSQGHREAIHELKNINLMFEQGIDFPKIENYIKRRIEKHERELK